jgi:glycerol-3-phosphate dehydrogenase
MEAEIDFIVETASKYLAAIPTRDDILSVFAGIRPLVKSGTATKTSSLSRGHHLFVDASGLVTITVEVDHISPYGWGRCRQGRGYRGARP